MPQTQYIIGTLCRLPLILKTINFVRSKNLSLNNQIFPWLQRYRGLNIWRCGKKNSNPLKLLPVKQCLFFFAYSKIRSKLFENLQNLKILVFSIILLNFIILYFPWNVHRSLLQEYHEGSNQGLFSSPRVGWYAPIDPSHKPGRQPSPYPAHSLSGNSWKKPQSFFIKSSSPISIQWGRLLISILIYIKLLNRIHIHNIHAWNKEKCRLK